MPSLYKFEFQCALCDKVAGTVTIGPKEEERSLSGAIAEKDKGFFVKITGPFQTATRIIVKDEFVRIKRLMEGRDFRIFYQKYQDNISFYCPKCSAYYCKDHWTNCRVFMDEGYFDYCSADCPKGHEVIVDD